MHLIFIANNRLPTEKAHGLQMVKTCEALADSGGKVTLITPKIKRYEELDLYQYYRSKANFDHLGLLVPYLLNWGMIGFSLRSLWLGLKAVWWARYKQVDYVYSRELLLLVIFSLFGYKTVWEVHDVRQRWFTKIGLNFISGLVVITTGLKKVYLEDFGYKRNILVAPDGVDLSIFDIKLTKTEARSKLNLPLDKQLIIYTGHLYSWKGVDTLAEAAKLLNDNQLVVLVGGTEVDLLRFKTSQKNNSNILIAGRQPHELIPFYLQAADLLVLPNSGKEAISRFYTSPLKLFEYMASGRPIIASDLPSIKEVLSEDTAFLVSADNPIALAEMIKYVCNNSELAKNRALNALTLVNEYTWDKRTDKINEYLKTL